MAANIYFQEYVVFTTRKLDAGQGPRRCVVCEVNPSFFEYQKHLDSHPVRKESGYCCTACALNMPENIRVLFVDDEPTLRIVWPAILAGEGFQVSVASTVPEALRLITAEKYDVLIADLNIGQPGDGFTVTSAMRRVQPNVLTIILTGYPAFQAALRAIHADRAQVLALLFRRISVS